MSNVISAPSLIGPLDNIDNTANPVHVQDTPSSNQSELNAAEWNKSKQGEFTALAAVKPVCCGAGSTDALPPLKSDIGGLPGVEGSEPGQRNSHLHSDISVEGMMGTEPGREGSDVGGKEAIMVGDPPATSPLISRDGKPDGM